MLIKVEKNCVHLAWSQNAWKASFASIEGHSSLSRNEQLFLRASLSLSINDPIVFEVSARLASHPYVLARLFEDRSLSRACNSRYLSFFLPTTGERQRRAKAKVNVRTYARFRSGTARILPPAWHRKESVSAWSSARRSRQVLLSTVCPLRVFTVANTNTDTSATCNVL